MAEFSNYVEARDPVVTADGNELIPVSKGGAPARMTSQQIANLANDYADTIDLHSVLLADPDGAGLQIKNIGNATDAQDAVTLAQLNAAALAIVTSWKAPVAVASTANLTLSGEQTIDGVLTSASRILVKNQSTQSQNGIYVTAAGAWARSSDADVAAELEGAAVTVQQGTSNANTTWIQTTDGITLGASNIVWSQLGTSVPDASATDKGIVELATPAEVITGTDTVRAVTPQGYAQARVLGLAFSDELTALSLGTDKLTFHFPYTTTIQEIWVEVKTAQTSGSILTIDVHKNGTTILSTKLTIDNNEETSLTAATPAVISVPAVTKGDKITIDVDQIGNLTAIAGKIWFRG